MNNILALADWRRQIAEAYAMVRAEKDVRQAWVAWRKIKDDLFHRHSQSPIPADRRSHYAGAPFFPYDPRWRFEVGFQPLTDEKIEQAHGGGDGMIRLRAFARTNGLKEVLGKELTLFWIEGYGGGLFLPFRDGTSGKETYGGGRYLLDSIKGADLGNNDRGQMIVDFNFSYHPSCYYSPEWVCPLAPMENHLEVAITGGEKS